MHKILSMAVIGLGIVTSTGYAAQEKCNLCAEPGDGPYASVGIGIFKLQTWKGGLTGVTTHFNQNVVYRFAIGSQFSNLRAEFEPSYARAKYTTGSNSGHVRMVSTLGNLYLGLPFESEFISYPVAPYIGVGIGFSSVNTNGGVPSQLQTQAHSTVLAYQGIAGIRFALTEKVGVNVEYRYFSTEKSNILARRLKSHSGNIGMTYRF